LEEGIDFVAAAAEVGAAVFERATSPSQIGPPPI
jgi:hypothetical protein